MNRNWSHIQLRDWILDYFEKNYKYGDKLEVSVDTASKIAESLNARMGIAINRRINYIHKWNNASNYPKLDTKIIVKDKFGNEYDNHTWNGHCYYDWVEDEDGNGDGYPTDVEVMKWRYQ
jgi:hypothetical protein